MENMWRSVDEVIQLGLGLRGVLPALESVPLWLSILDLFFAGASIVLESWIEVFSGVEVLV